MAQHQCGESIPESAKVHSQPQVARRLVGAHVEVRPARWRSATRESVAEFLLARRIVPEAWLPELLLPRQRHM